MASEQHLVDYICEQMRGAGPIASRKMFGEYAIYCRPKVVALVCDTQLFVKPTASGKTVIGTPNEAPPYPGAKPYYLIENRDDADWLTRIIAATAQELPVPKPRKKKAGTTPTEPGAPGPSR